MRTRLCRVLSVFAVVLLAALASRVAVAQSPAGRLVEEARAQLDELNPDSAVVLLTWALDATGGATVREQVRGWTLFGIAELMRGNTQAGQIGRAHV